MSSMSGVLNSLRFRLISEIDFALKIFTTPLRDCVVLAVSRKGSDQPGFVKFRQSTSDCFVGDRDLSIFEIIRNPLEIVPSARIIEEFEDDIITTSHPVCSVPGHELMPEEPSKTLFDVIHGGSIIGHSVKSYPQELMHMGKDLDIRPTRRSSGLSTLEKLVDACGTSTGAVSVN